MADTGQPTTRVAYILDKSVSMACCREEAIKGANDYMEALRSENPDARVTVTLFDTEVYRVIESVPVREITQLAPDAYIPSGWTALYDAVGSSIAAIGAEAQDGDIVLVSIFTDGEENASHEFSHETIRDLIGKHEKKGWTFAYLGANHDAWAAAESIGIARDNTVRFAVVAADDAFAKAGRIQSRFLRRRREAPEDQPQTMFATGNIEDEAEPEPELQPGDWKRPRKNPRKKKQ